MADCTECMWWMSIDKYCLLTRDAKECSHHPARRGDKELVDRILALADDRRRDLKRRFDAAPGGGSRVDARADSQP